MKATILCSPDVGDIVNLSDGCAYRITSVGNELFPLAGGINKHPVTLEKIADHVMTTGEIATWKGEIQWPNDTGSRGI